MRAVFAAALLLAGVSCNPPPPPEPIATVDQDARMIEAEEVFDRIMSMRAPYLERGMDPHRLEVLLPARYEGPIADWLDTHSSPEDDLFQGAIPEGTHLFGMPTYFGPYPDVIVQPQADTE